MNIDFGQGVFDSTAARTTRSIISQFFPYFNHLHPPINFKSLTTVPTTTKTESDSSQLLF